MIIYQLFRPFGYLAIHHPAKRTVDWLIPSILTILVLLVFYLMGSQADTVWGGSGLVERVQGLIQGLPGFYIAALAVVATFGRKSNLDSLIPEPTPTISTVYGSGKMMIELTRRRFLSLLFAYLTALSISLSVMSSLMQWVVMSVISDKVEFVIYLATLIYFLFVFQLIVVTFWGLYYLSDRMHQPDPTPSSD